MPFFAPLPPEPEPAPRTEHVPPVWQHPPGHEVPAAVPIARLLARVPGAALTLQRIDVHREGALFALRTDVILDDSLDDEQEKRVRDMLDPRGMRPFAHGDLLRIGVELADGSRAETDGGPGVWMHSISEDEPAGPLLTFRGGQGGPVRRDRWTTHLDAWLWPLPPAGPFRLHFESEALGIPEGSIRLDGAELREAAEDVLDITPR